MAGGTSRYGWYRYGRRRYRPDTAERTELYEDKGPSYDELFGAGVALRTADDADSDDENVPWDFVADSSGDLAATEGLDEIAKDVSFQAAQDSVSLVGTLTSASDRARVENRLERIMHNDSRVTGSEASVVPHSSRPDLTSFELDIGVEMEEVPSKVIPFDW